MDISRPCQPEKLIPLLPWPGFDPSFSVHNDRRAITSEWTRLRLKPLSHRGWLQFGGIQGFLVANIASSRFMNNYSGGGGVNRDIDASPRVEMGGGVSYWTCWQEISGDRATLFLNVFDKCAPSVGSFNPIVYRLATKFRSDKRPVGLIATPFKINFLATENWPKMKLKSVRILRKIIHLASGSHIWSFFAQKHMLTKSKSRSIASKITNLESRKSYLSIHYFTQFLSKVDQK